MTNHVMKNNYSKFLLSFILFTIILGCSTDSTTDPICTPIICLNGGTSTVDCGCNCPTGYTGDNCGIQVTPTKILIEKIVVVKFPNFRTDGSNWDGGSLLGFEKPDIFPVLFDSSNQVIFAGTPKQDCFSTGNDSFNFFPSSPIQITNLSSPLSLILFDEDSSTNQELMGGFQNILLYSSTGGFPPTITIGNSSNSFIFRLDLSYVW